MVKMELHGHTKTHIVEAGQRTIIVISIKFLAYSSKFSQNFREIAGNPINLNFRDKNFVIATFFVICRRRAPLAGRTRFPRPQLHVARRSGTILLLAVKQRGKETEETR